MKTAELFKEKLTLVGGSVDGGSVTGIDDSKLGNSLLKILHS